jgi:hypothetical protein
MPSLVGGQVIGSVLVLHDQPLSDESQDRVRESVMQAGPILANLRSSCAPSDAPRPMPSRGCRTPAPSFGSRG